MDGTDLLWAEAFYKFHDVYFSEKSEQALQKLDYADYPNVNSNELKVIFTGFKNFWIK